MSKHKFETSKFAKLDSPERRELLPIEQILAPLAERDLFTKVADIGCGIGYLTVPMAKMLQTAGEIYAIDISSEMLEVLRERVEGLANVQIVQSTENQVPLPSQLIDISFMLTVFHELNDPVRYIQEIKRFSKPEHRIVIVDWTKKERNYGPPVTRALAKEEVIGIFTQQGYKLEREYMDGQNVYGLVFYYQ